LDERTNIETGNYRDKITTVVILSRDKITIPVTE